MTGKPPAEWQCKNWRNQQNVNNFTATRNRKQKQQATERLKGGKTKRRTWRK